MTTTAPALDAVAFFTARMAFQTDVSDVHAAHGPQTAAYDNPQAAAYDPQHSADGGPTGRGAQERHR